ncbi:MAG: lipocalin family protein [Bacteroidetes bacterium]|nr:lipocalin family protein [Bacteroidota bacterium]
MKPSKKVASLFLTISLVLVVLFSCKKKETEEPPVVDEPTKANKELLINKNWKMTSLMFGTIDFYSTIAACESDDISIFSADSTFVIDEGLTKCNTADPQTKSTGVWIFIDNDTKLVMTPTTGNPDTGAIVQLDESVFKLRVKVPPYGEAVATFSKQ